MAQKPLLYHHARPLESIVHGEVAGSPKREQDKHFRHAYEWMQQRVGFYPVFLSVGRTEQDLQETGYAGQWRRGSTQNKALFSFEETSGIFYDAGQWEIALFYLFRDVNRASGYGVPARIEEKLFRKSRTTTGWLRYALRSPGWVHLVTPRLYLPDAKRVWVRNKNAKKALEKKGFENVFVQRLRVEN